MFVNSKISVWFEETNSYLNSVMSGGFTVIKITENRLISP